MNYAYGMPYNSFLKKLDPLPARDFEELWSLSKRAAVV
jgi:hypothetical protein